MMFQNCQPTTTTKIQFSAHSVKRCQQRAVSNWAIEQAILKGEKIYKQGNTFHFMKRKFVISNYSPQQHNQLIDLVVLMSEDNTIITAYKNSAAIGNIKRKPKRLAKRKNEFLNFDGTSSSKPLIDKVNQRIAA
jgi:hypothetical protein